MLNRKAKWPCLRSGRVGRSVLSFTFGLLLIEFLDELIFGAREAAWPLIRDDLRLSYVQVGLLISVPIIIGGATELLLGILADVWNRRALILGGGVAYVSALLLVAASPSFAVLLLALILINPASGAFVGLAQASLMDAEPARHEHNMARWTLAGSLGVVSGPLVVGACLAIGASWRELFFAGALVGALLLKLLWRFPFASEAGGEQSDGLSLKVAAQDALKSLRRREVLRWLVLLLFSDLMLDVLNGFLALYFVDSVGVSQAKAGLAIGVWAGVGLAGDFLLIPLLKRVRGLRYLRYSAFLVLCLFPAFLLVQGYGAKLMLVGLLGLLNSGWYSILKAQLYRAMPGRSGTVMTFDSLFSIAGGSIPLCLAAVATRFGLDAALWLLLVGPLALLIGIPRRE